MNVVRPWLILLAASCAFCSAARANTPADETRQDVRCLVVALSILQVGRPETTGAAVVSFTYLEGRIDGRRPELDLETAIRNELAQRRPADFQSEAQRCGRLLSERGQAVQAIGRRLQEHPPEPPGPAHGI
jgi:hypothetical protein